jgi:hypothetical protein
LANKFENVKLSYFFDNLYSQHVIVVTPSNIYSDDTFAKEQVDLEIDFINYFPYESLYFVERENIEITSEFEFECVSIQQYNLIFNQLAENILTKLLINPPKIVLTTSGSFYNSSKVANTCKIVDSGVEDLQYQPIEKNIKYGEEISYAMAA